MRNAVGFIGEASGIVSRSCVWVWKGGESEATEGADGWMWWSEEKGGAFHSPSSNKIGTEFFSTPDYSLCILLTRVSFCAFRPSPSSHSHALPVSDTLISLALMNFLPSSAFAAAAVNASALAMRSKVRGGLGDGVDGWGGWIEGGWVD